MSAEPQLFRVNPETHESESITEVEFAALGFQERRDIQEWVASNPSILGEDLLIIGKEFSGFDRTNERLDLLAIDADGTLVVIELKRDHSGTDAHWQAIKYASYFHHAKDEDIVRMLADYGQTSEEDATGKVLQHLDADDLGSLNNDQRIILASHRFAPEVTSAALWLNEKAPDENLITCVQLTPYQDGDALYIQANTIIPVPGLDVIGIGRLQDDVSIKNSGGFGDALSKTFRQSKNHPATPFFNSVHQLAVTGLPDEIKPQRKSKWAGRGGGNSRYYHLWYSTPPWSNWGTSYRITLYPKENEQWQAIVEFRHDQGTLLQSRIASDHIYDNLKVVDEGVDSEVGTDALNEDFANKIAETMSQFIRTITPIVNDFLEELNEESA